GNLKKSDYNIICKWILKAWAEIPKGMIVKSFKKYGINNAMNGSEDDLFGQDETKKNDDKREILNINSDSADEYLADESNKLNE
ncbi:6491_t:CDS:1, partial [Funneliformis geosporum]